MGQVSNWTWASEWTWIVQACVYADGPLQHVVSVLFFPQVRWRLAFRYALVRSVHYLYWGQYSASSSPVSSTPPFPRPSFSDIQKEKRRSTKHILI